MAAAPADERRARLRSATKLWPEGVTGIPYPPQPPAPLEYPCPECATSFSRETQLKFHYRNHVYPRWRYKFTFDCLICFLKFENAPQLGRHYALKHKGRNGTAAGKKRTPKPSGNGGKGMTWNCPMCDKVYTASPSLKEHILDKHLDLRLFRCKFCNRRFAKKYNMEQHVLAMH